MADRRRPIAPIALFAVLAAALAMGGCGRKGPLDLPPSAAAEPAAGPTATRSSGVNPMARHKPAQPRTEAFTSSGEPVAPKGPSRPLPMDWLID